MINLAMICIGMYFIGWVFGSVFSFVLRFFREVIE